MEIHVYQTAPDRGLAGQTVFTGIQEAYDRLVELHERGENVVPARILVHGGTYRISKPLHFYADLPVTVEAYRKDRVIVSGGKLIGGWSKTRIGGKTVFRASIPENISELPFFYVNGRAAEPARWPKKGWLKVTDEEPGFLKGIDDRKDAFHVEEGAFDPKWYDPGNILIKMIHFWIDENLRFESWDEKKHEITTATGITGVCNKETEYVFTNVKEALSEANEFYFDRLKHEVDPQCQSVIFFQFRKGVGEGVEIIKAHLFDRGDPS